MYRGEYGPVGDLEPDFIILTGSGRGARLSEGRGEVGASSGGSGALGMRSRWWWVGSSMEPGGVGMDTTDVDAILKILSTSGDI